MAVADSASRGRRVMRASMVGVVGEWGMSVCGRIVELA